jgi:hypothetical protein
MSLQWQDLGDGLAVSANALARTKYVELLRVLTPLCGQSPWYPSSTLFAKCEGYKSSCASLASSRGLGLAGRQSPFQGRRGEPIMRILVAEDNSVFQTVHDALTLVSRHRAVLVTGQSGSSQGRWLAFSCVAKGSVPTPLYPLPFVPTRFSLRAWENGRHYAATLPSGKHTFRSNNKQSGIELKARTVRHPSVEVPRDLVAVRAGQAVCGSEEGPDQ